MIATRRRMARQLRDLGEQTHQLAVRLRPIDQDGARDVMRAATLLRETAYRVGRPTYDGGSGSWRPGDDR